jgi:GNAT superfamily N-acetyltransferase
MSKPNEKTKRQTERMEYTFCKVTDKMFIELTACLDAELGQRYGAAQAAFQPHNTVECGEAIIASEDGTAMGCCCFKRYDDETAELKRMYVKPDYRGKGIAQEFLKRLENRASEMNYNSMILETGIKQPEAIRLYEKSGYVRISNYGPYADMPDSVCFRKALLVTAKPPQ